MTKDEEIQKQYPETYEATPPKNEKQGSEERPEELILSLYKKISEQKSRGKYPEKLFLSLKNYQIIQRYHRQLGALSHEENDYISKDALFGVEIFIDNRRDCLVE